MLSVGAIVWLCILAVVVVLIIVCYCRSRNVKFLDGSSINYITSERFRPTAVVHCLLTFDKEMNPDEFREWWCNTFMKETAFNSRVVVRRLLWSYFDKEEAFDINEHLFVHNEPITMDEFRHFSEKQINV